MSIKQDLSIDEVIPLVFLLTQAGHIKVVKILVKRGTMNSVIYEQAHRGTSRFIPPSCTTKKISSRLLTCFLKMSIVELIFCSRWVHFSS